MLILCELHFNKITCGLKYEEYQDGLLYGKLNVDSTAFWKNLIILNSPPFSDDTIYLHILYQRIINLAFKGDIFSISAGLKSIYV